MVKNIILVFFFILIGCSKFEGERSILNKEQTSQVGKMTNQIYSKDQKEELDKNYLNSLDELNISDVEFLNLSKYVINCFHRDLFLEEDAVLGQKEFLSNKDYTNPRIPYVYSQIPNHNDIRVVVIYDKSKKIDKVAISYVSGWDFIIKGDLNIIKALNLKFVRKEKSEYSNIIYNYYYTDGVLNYKVEAQSSSEEEHYPEKFYSFVIMRNQ